MAFTRETLRLVEQVRATLAQLLDGLVRRLTRAWVRAWDQLADDFTAALDDLLAGQDRWPSRVQIHRASRLQAAVDAAGRVLDQLMNLVRSETAAAAREAVEAAGRAQPEIIASQLPPGLARDRMLARLHRFSQRSLAAIITRTGERITALTRPLSQEATSAMRRELIRGVALGDNPREAARRMVRRTEGVFNGGLTRAMTIARTEMIDAHRAAAAAGQQASAEVLRGWRWLAALDTRSCPACWAMHGTVHPLTEPGPLGHPQCRCSRAPLTRSWRDLGFDLDEPDDAVPDAQAVFNALPAADQLRIMGPARLTALKGGHIAWADLAGRHENPGWRPSYTTVPLKDLLPA